MPFLLLLLGGTAIGGLSFLAGKKIAEKENAELAKEYYRCIEKLLEHRVKADEIRRICNGWRVGSLTFSKALAIAAISTAMIVGIYAFHKQSNRELQLTPIK